VTHSTTVAAALIVRNEAHFLGGCLDSLRGRVDEIVIIDTGSTDDTMAIAERAGVRPCRRPWRDDFSEARNAALEAVTCDWVLYIDADERLRLPEGEKLRSYIDPTSVGGFVRFRPRAAYTRYRELRLFRSNPRIRFRGRIHESVWPSIVTASGADQKITGTTVEINHLGYDGDQCHKHPRNLPLLQAAARDEPDRIYYWYHLAETLVALGRAKEAESFALEGYARVDRHSSGKQLADPSLLLQTLVRLQLNRGETPLELIREGLSRVPDDYALLFFLGRASLNSGQPDLALEIAERLLTIDVLSLDDGMLAFDRALFGENACELAAIACLRLGRLFDAAAHFARAAQFAPNERHFWIKSQALGA
jgi:glycosyltransferase involved in cell wall biosynthesis